MDIPWDDVRLLLAISESGSLSGAARRLAIGQPPVSPRLAELESARGYGLFRRTAGTQWFNVPTDSSAALVMLARAGRDQ